jgi:hypothetical protein
MSEASRAWTQGRWIFAVALRRKYVTASRTRSLRVITMPAGGLRDLQTGLTIQPDPPSEHPAAP